MYAFPPRCISSIDTRACNKSGVIRISPLIATETEHPLPGPNAGSRLYPCVVGPAHEGIERCDERANVSPCVVQGGEP